MKTDDDCFVDVARVVAGLRDRGLAGRPRVWWSQFREGWPVARLGKWAERDYTSTTYPAFACGAGGVLSLDLVEHLAINSRSLHAYQGEDTSMGIWLAPTSPNLVRDASWSCFRRCARGVLTSPERSPDELRAMWRALESCDNPCGCT